MVRHRRRTTFRMSTSKLLTLFIIILIIISIVLIIYTSLRNWRASYLLKQAARAETGRNLDQAVLYLEHYLDYRPSDSDALEAYASVLIKRAASRGSPTPWEALAALEQAVQSNPRRDDRKRRLAQTAIELRRPDIARPHLEILLQSAPNDGELEHLLGQCLEADGENEKAAIYLNKATQHAPGRIESYVLLADLLHKLDQPRREHLEQIIGRGADEVMDGMVATNIESYKAYLARARYRRKFGRADAEQDMVRARVLGGDEREVILAAPKWAKDSKEARDQLERGIKMYPNDGAMYESLACLDLTTGRSEEAITSLRKAIQASPERKHLLCQLAFTLVETGKLEEATGFLARLRKEDYPRSALDCLEAEIFIKKSMWLEASKILDRLSYDVEFGAIACSLLGKCRTQLHDFEGRLDAFERLVEKDPGSAVARDELCSALLAMGMVAPALSQNRRLIEMHSVPASDWPVLIRMLIRQCLSLPREERDWHNVESVLDQVTQALPKSVQIPLLHAEVFTAKGQYERAWGLLERERDMQPAHIEFWIGLASLSRRQHQSEKTFQILDEAQKQVGDAIELRLMRSMYRVGQRTDDLLELLEELTQDLEKLPDKKDRLRLLDTLAGACYPIADEHGAGRLLTHLTEQQPQNVPLKLLLIELAFRSGDEAAMRRYLDDTRHLRESQRGRITINR
jgi:tetratricopeptide (TPR) repeat protein